MKKILLTVFLLLGAGAAFVALRYPSAVVGLVRGSNPVSTYVEGSADIILTDIATYRQDASGWASDTLGQTSDTMAGYGCTVTSVANAITNVTGRQMSPKVLNAALSQINGYTSQGWLIWSKITEATNGAVQVTVHDTPTQAGIEACMAGGGYPIVKIKLGGVIPHWVMLSGRQNGEYLMRDPLRGGPSDPAIAVSTRARQIHSLRCLSKI